MQANEVVVNGVTELSLVNDTVSETSLLEGETAHAANGEAIIGKAKYINPNLLDNPDFSINQRGQTEYTGTRYTVDRWRLSGDGMNLVINDDKTITVSNKGVSTGWLVHIFENYNAFDGKAVTLTSCDVDGNIVSASEIVPIGTPSSSYKILELSLKADVLFNMYKRADEKMIVQYVISPGASITLKQAKLELGTVATPFVPPNPALESIKCQRMLQYHTTGDINPVDLRPIMRITPTVVQQANGRWMYNAEL